MEGMKGMQRGMNRDEGDEGDAERDEQG